MMNMFKVQMDMFLKHHSAAKEQEQEFFKTQQIEVRTTQKELMDQQKQASIFQHVLSRLPKLSGKSKVASFFPQFEKTLKIMIFHQGSGCRHCKQVWMDR